MGAHIWVNTEEDSGQIGSIRIGQGKIKKKY